MIQNIKENGIAEIYTHSEDSFSVGEVCFQNKDCILIRGVDEQGKVTAYYAMKKSIITSVEYDTEYLNKLEKYMEYGNVHTYSSWFSLNEVKFDDAQPLFPQILQYSYKNNRMVTIAISTMEQLETGYIRQLLDDRLEIECVDMETAKLDGCITVNIDEISFIEFDSVDNFLLQYANERIEGE